MTNEFSNILPKDSVVEKLNHEPFVFIEGPVWDKEKKQLYFSDPLARTIIVMKETGKFHILCADTGYVNGMCLNNRGNLAVCNMENGSLDEICTETGETLAIIASGYENRPFNATNDVVCDEKGGYYVTDPFFLYGPKAQDVEATYYCAPNGVVTRVATDSVKPNGLAFSLDGKKLYIDDTGATAVWSYCILPDGTLSKGTIICNLKPPENTADLPKVQQHGEADGMKVDECGNIYVTTYSGIQVFCPEGELLGIIKMPGDETPANCEFGDADRKTLYITARTSLYKVRLNVAGA